MKYKNIPRLYLDKGLKKNEIIEISIKDKHYLCNVMRLKEGDSFKVFNGFDGEWQAIILSSKKNTVKCYKQIKVQENFYGPSLYFAIIKSNNLKWMIEKVTELGVKKLIPVITERTNLKTINRKKILAHIKEAAEVSERIELPKLQETINLKKVIEEINLDKSTLIFCNENRDDKSLFDVFRNRFGKKISFLIGPEGGFTIKELETLKSEKNIIPVKLDERILRADTAAILAISAYKCYYYYNE